MRIVLILAALFGLAVMWPVEEMTIWARLTTDAPVWFALVIVGEEWFS